MTSQIYTLYMDYNIIYVRDVVYFSFTVLLYISVLYNLKVRFEERNIIYTYCGKYMVHPVLFNHTPKWLVP